VRNGKVFQYYYSIKNKAPIKDQSPINLIKKEEPEDIAAYNKESLLGRQLIELNDTSFQ
jgi:hypothetical protein